MHGQYRRLTEQPPVDMKEIYRWLKAATISAATEGLVVAAQDQDLRTRYYERKILHHEVKKGYSYPEMRHECSSSKTAAGCNQTLLKRRWPMKLVFFQSVPSLVQNRGSTSVSHSRTGVPHRFFETVPSKILRLHAFKATRLTS